MNPAEQPKTSNAPASSGGIKIEDILFTLFRHKWLISTFVCIGVAGALAVRITRPPLFISTAKILVHFVVERGSVNPADQEGRVLSPESGQANIMSSEIEILKSLDVATNVVAMVG